ncbi:iron-containing alcohol dehydrogenase family protein [Metabacillus iocasae]|uniref:Oxidoreductase n=1 Tax=Priestia iocasae TaxID=2291674 RepID=A0ABS2QZ15_9BACI|nr:iron-containing alcohol dehydrogenase family protein [Metabacillus iocasae]MBM7704724.1 putative oxidoreductase [Metabacillus iocasae]
MKTLLEVRGAPSYYVCQTGILSMIEEKLQKQHIKKALFIHGQKSLEAAQPFLPHFHKVQTFYRRYQGECSLEEIKRLYHEARLLQVDVIIGVGGGKILDLAKAVGHEAQLEVVLIPTLASTCAAWTPLSVIYDEKGTYIRYDVYPKSTWMVLVEPRLILTSPVSYLRAGLGDTLAKWYEADALLSKVEERTTSMEIAHTMAKMCHQTLLTHGKQAIVDLAILQPSHSLIQTIETIIMTGGMVGGFGDHYGRVATAHSIHNGLTTVKQTHHLLHGEKVAYGILVQLFLEYNREEIKRLLSFYRDIKLPYSLKTLGISRSDEETVHQIAKASVQPGEAIYAQFPSIDANQVYKAMIDLETFIETHLSLPL